MVASGLQQMISDGDETLNTLINDTLYNTTISEDDVTYCGQTGYFDDRGRHT